MASQKEAVPEVPSAVASALSARRTLPRRLAQALSRWNKRKRMFGAILSPHRQLQITHMASVSESMPLSTEAERETIQCLASKMKNKKDS